MVRLLPVLACLLLGAALGLKAGWLSVIPAVILIGFSGTVYYISNKTSKDA